MSLRCSAPYSEHPLTKLYIHLLIFPPSATVEEERTAAHRRGGYLGRVLRPENSAQTLLYFGSRRTLAAGTAVRYTRANLRDRSFRIYLLVERNGDKRKRELVLGGDLSVRDRHTVLHCRPRRPRGVVARAGCPIDFRSGNGYRASNARKWRRTCPAYEW
ncbi:hypothetical protein ALC60_06168 [Trachymyrmex zeteki]|uniref:Uncharacterized protein n=1 Tax=Mycetomoellerius zeteki TaxID=64791 RepID=A0A151X3N9_9HYME|nr:hypothetical protein ALC60_06168 [Trachymyrmex zeteki]